MALTKPAGVFLQLISIPVMIGGCMTGLGEDGSVAGWVVFGIGVLMLVYGGTPARRAKEKE